MGYRCPTVAALSLWSILSPSSITTTALWVPHNVPLSSRRIRSLSSTTRLLSSPNSPFFGPEEEFVCPDEDECEIDWDKMPDFITTTDDKEENKMDEKIYQVNDNVDVEEGEEEDESDIDLQPLPTYGSSTKEISLNTRRVRLEMNWQIQECQSDEDSCTDFCPDCAGSGKRPCRFCRGTGIIVLGKEFLPCLICSHTSHIGHEECPSCRGTGRIAPWASTMNEHFQIHKP